MGQNTGFDSNPYPDKPSSAGGQAYTDANGVYHPAGESDSAGQIRTALNEYGIDPASLTDSNSLIDALTKVSLAPNSATDLLGQNKGRIITGLTNALKGLQAQNKQSSPTGSEISALDKGAAGYYSSAADKNRADIQHQSYTDQLNFLQTKFNEQMTTINTQLAQGKMNQAQANIERQLLNEQTANQLKALELQQNQDLNGVTQGTELARQEQASMPSIFQRFMPGEKLGPAGSAPGSVVAPTVNLPFNPFTFGQSQFSPALAAVKAGIPGLGANPLTLVTGNYANAPKPPSPIQITLPSVPNIPNPQPFSPSAMVNNYAVGTNGGTIGMQAGGPGASAAGGM